MRITKKMIKKNKQLQKELKDTAESPPLGHMIMGIKIIKVKKDE